MRYLILMMLLAGCGEPPICIEWNTYDCTSTKQSSTCEDASIMTDLIRHVERITPDGERCNPPAYYTTWREQMGRLDKEWTYGDCSIQLTANTPGEATGRANCLIESVEHPVLCSVIVNLECETK